MNLIFYGTETDEPGKRLQRVLEAVVPEKKREICRTIEGLCQRLRRPVDDLDIAVLLAASREELSDILSIRDLLTDIRVILVLPDRADDTIAKGHTLRPRFFTYADSDFVEIAAVLSKMLASNYPYKKAAIEGGD